MTVKPSNDGYHLMGSYYDVFFTDHLEWFDEVRKDMLGEVLPKAKSVCDVGCGTGSTALSFASKGIRTFALDISSTMCDIAKSKAKKAKVSMNVICGDMRNFQLPEEVDLVLSEFDSINHVAKKSELGSVLESVHRALAPGGHFMFDVNGANVYRYMWPRARLFEKRGVVFICHGGWDDKRNKAFMDTDFFVQNGKNWTRHSERVEQVCWTPEEVQRAVELAGFTLVRSTDAAELKLNDKPMVPPGFITFYVVRK
jgi:SAM-dependent methyltransferase